MKYCTNCGASVSEHAKFCSKCGNPIKLDDINNKQDSEELKLKHINNEKDHAEAQNVNDEDVSNSNFNEEESLDSKVREKADDIDNTMKFNLSREMLNNTEENCNADSDNQGMFDNKDERRERNPKKKNKSLLNGLLPKVIIGVLVIAAILCGVFFSKISARYYMIKCNNAMSSEEKITYAAKAVKADDNNDTMELLKNTLINLAKNDLDLAEDKLKELSNILNQSDIKNISIAIKEKKIDNLCSSSNYEAVINEFNELDKLGVDFKKNKHYDDVMLNITSKLTGCSVKGNKNALMEDEAIYYDNMDDDIFDEIIEVKQGRKYDSFLKVNLYKFIDGKYKLVDTKTINTSENEGIQGIFDYEEGHKGVYVSYESTAGRTYGTSVYSVEDSRLVLKGIVYGNNYTKAEDTNDDGIYEVISSSTNYILSSRKEVIKAYSIHDDGRTPTELSDNKNDDSDTSSEEDYIFPNSDKAYLTEEDLRNLSKEKLALARNEIFARHGYVFKEEPFKSYFESKNWYSPNPNFDGSDSGLNDYEIANYKVIQNWEKK